MLILAVQVQTPSGEELTHLKWASLEIFWTEFRREKDLAPPRGNQQRNPRISTNIYTRGVKINDNYIFWGEQQFLSLTLSCILLLQSLPGTILPLLITNHTTQSWFRDGRRWWCPPVSLSTTWRRTGGRNKRLHNHHRPNQIGLLGPVSHGPTPHSWHSWFSSPYTNTVMNISSDLSIFTTFVIIVLMIFLFVLQIHPFLCSVPLKYFVPTLYKVLTRGITKTEICSFPPHWTSKFEIKPPHLSQWSNSCF